MSETERAPFDFGLFFKSKLIYVIDFQLVVFLEYTLLLLYCTFHL